MGLTLSNGYVNSDLTNSTQRAVWAAIMAFWKKSDENGALGNKLVRTQPNSEYWGAKAEGEDADTPDMTDIPADSAGTSMFKSVTPTSTQDDHLLEASAYRDDSDEQKDDTIGDAESLAESNEVDEHLAEEVEVPADNEHSDDYWDHDEAVEDETSEAEYATADTEAGDTVPYAAAVEPDFVSEDDYWEDDQPEIATTETNESLGPSTEYDDSDDSSDEYWDEPTEAQKTDISEEPAEYAPQEFEAEAIEEADKIGDYVDEEADTGDVEIATSTSDHGDVTEGYLDDEDNEFADEPQPYQSDADTTVHQAIGDYADADADVDEVAPEDYDASEYDAEESIAGVDNDATEVETVYAADDVIDEAVIEHETASDWQSPSVAYEDDAMDTELETSAEFDDGEYSETETPSHESADDYYGLSEDGDEATGEWSDDADTEYSDTDGEYHDDADDADVEAVAEDTDEATQTDENANIIAWPLNRSDATDDDGDALSDEERTAIASVSDDAEDESAVAFAPPVEDTADFTDEPEYDYRTSAIAGVEADQIKGEDSSEYYYSTAKTEPLTASQTGGGGGRRAALYLAGAASLSTICAVGYFLLQNGDGDDANATIQTTDVTPDSGSPTQTASNETGAVVTPESAKPEAASIPEFDFGSLKTTDADSGDAVTVDEADIIGTQDPVVEKATTGAPKVAERELSGPQVALSIPKADKPAATADTVVEKEVPPTVVMPAPVASPSPKPAPPKTQLADNRTAPIAPKVESKPAPAPSPKPVAPRVPTAQKTPPVSVASAPKVSSQSVTSPVAPRVPAASTLRASSLPAFPGLLSPDSIAAQTLDRLSGANGSLTSAQREKFAQDMHRSFETTRDYERTAVTTAKGDRAVLDFGVSRSQMQTMSVERAANTAQLPIGMQTSSGWYQANGNVPLMLEPSRSAMATTRLAPGVKVHRLGVIEQANGDRWYVIGQDGVIVGYAHASDLSPASASAMTSGSSVLKLPVASTVQQTVMVETPCRDLTVSTNSGAMATTGCLSASGQWITTRPPQTDLAAATSNYSGGVAGISEDVAGILFSPVSERRNQRHARTETYDRLSDMIGAGRPVAVANADGSQSLVRITTASDESLRPVSEAQAIKQATCRTAAYVTVAETKEITACLQPNGSWRTVSRRGGAYKMRTLARLG